MRRKQVGPSPLGGDVHLDIQQSAPMLMRTSYRQGFVKLQTASRAMATAIA